MVGHVIPTFNFFPLFPQTNLLLFQVSRSYDPSLVHGSKIVHLGTQSMSEACVGKTAKTSWLF